MMDIFHGIEKYHLDSDVEMKKRIEESDQIRKEGNELFVKGEYDKALHQCYLKAIKLTPNDARLFINSGLCSLKLADSSHNVKIRTIHAHNAFVYGFAAFLIQKYELKPLYILYQAYDLLGYSAAKVKVMEKAKEYSYGTEYETFNVPRQLKNKPQRLDAADLRTSANSLLTESDVMEQLFHMCHVSFIVENEFDPSLSQGSPEKTLLKMNFLEKFMKMPVFVKLFANHSLYKDLSFEESMFMVLGIRFFMEVQYAKKDDGVKDCLYPEQFLKFITFLSKSLLDENTIKEFNRKKIPLSDTLLTNLIFVWDSLIRIDVNCAKFFELLQPIPPAEWILSLPMVFFSVFNPCHFHVVYQLLFRFINLALLKMENKEEQLNKKIPQWKLKQIFTGLASFGIVAERLFAYLEEGERNIKHFILYYQGMLLSSVLFLDEDRKKAIAEIPQMWLLFSHSLETYSSTISVINETMTIFEKLLEPWIYELDNVSPFDDNPAFRIAVDSLIKLLSPTGPIMKKSKVPEYTPTVLARLCAVSVDFKAKLREIISFKMIMILRNETLKSGDLAQLLWRIL